MALLQRVRRVLGLSSTNGSAGGWWPIGALALGAPLAIWTASVLTTPAPAQAVDGDERRVEERQRLDREGGDRDRPREGDRAREGDRPREVDRPREGDRPRELDRPREGDRPRELDRPREGDRPREADRPREGDRPRPREGEGRPPIRPDGPPRREGEFNPPPELREHLQRMAAEREQMGRMIQELREEVIRLRREMQEIRARQGDGPPPPRREGDFRGREGEGRPPFRPDGPPPREGDFRGRRDGDGPPPRPDAPPPPRREGEFREGGDRERPRDGERRLEGDRPRDGERRIEGDRPRDGERRFEGDRPRDGEGRPDVERREPDRREGGDREAAQGRAGGREFLLKEELRRHGGRLGELEAERRQAAEAGNTDALVRINELLRQEKAYHEKRLQELRGGADQR